ncbi:MAG: hypothetical protein OXI55_01970 [Gammaproteobacteria bacterium]|nr:hypothetical protein [Gammaproteobacteria bacterium]
MLREALDAIRAAVQVWRLRRVVAGVGREPGFGPTRNAAPLGARRETIPAPPNAATMLQAIAGHDPDDLISPSAPVPDTLEGIDRGRGLRLGLDRPRPASAGLVA